MANYTIPGCTMPALRLTLTHMTKVDTGVIKFEEQLAEDCTKYRKNKSPEIC